MNIIAAYREVGSYRGAAELCGTTPKTVRRVIQRHEAGGQRPQRKPRARNYDRMVELVHSRVQATRCRISDKRLLPAAWTAGYPGSPRNFRRLVAAEKRARRAEHHRGRRRGDHGDHGVDPTGVLTCEYGTRQPLTDRRRVDAGDGRRQRVVNFVNALGDNAGSRVLQLGRAPEGAAAAVKCPGTAGAPPPRAPLPVRPCGRPTGRIGRVVSGWRGRPLRTMRRSEASP
jgi:hypothetical protein